MTTFMQEMLVEIYLAIQRKKGFFTKKKYKMFSYKFYANEDIFMNRFVSVTEQILPNCTRLENICPVCGF